MFPGLFNWPCTIQEMSASVTLFMCDLSGPTQLQSVRAGGKESSERMTNIRVAVLPAS